MNVARCICEVGACHGVCRIGCITRAREGHHRSSRLFSFSVRLFLASRVNLGCYFFFFHSETQCTYAHKFWIVVERPPLDASEFSAFGRREEFSAVAFASEAPRG